MKREKNISGTIFKDKYDNDLTYIYPLKSKIKLNFFQRGGDSGIKHRSRILKF